MKINKILESTKNNVVYDSENQPLFIGDIVAYCGSREPGGLFPVKKDIIKEIIVEKNKIRLLNFNKLLFSKTVLKISKIASSEELQNNEDLVNYTLNKEKEDKKQKAKERITTKFILLAYEKDTYKILLLLKINSAPGKNINKKIVAEYINKLKYNNYYILNSNSEFEKFSNNTIPYIFKGSDINFNFNYNSNSKQPNSFEQFEFYQLNTNDIIHKKLLEQTLNTYSNYYTSTIKCKLSNKSVFIYYDNTTHNSIIKILQNIFKYYITDKEDTIINSFNNIIFN